MWAWSFPAHTLSFFHRVNLWIIPEMASGMEECKIPAWARDTMFSSPDGLVRRHLDRAADSCVRSCYSVSATQKLTPNKSKTGCILPNLGFWFLMLQIYKAYPEGSWILLAAFCQNLFAPLKLKRLPSSVLIESRFTSWFRMESRFSGPNMTVHCNKS